MDVVISLSLLFAAVVAMRGAQSLSQLSNKLLVTCEVEADGNYCRARCNDVVLDISNVFTYP